MNKHINYEDNIFILNIRIRMIRNLLILDSDPDLFLGKTLDDIDFIDGTLTVILESLLGQKQLIDPEEHFHTLSETETRFLEVLSELSHGEGTISVGRLPVIREKITTLQNRSRERQNTIGHSLSQTDALNTETAVSSTELRELLRDLK
ncbi:MAG: hypothetical protein LBQ38_07740 [Spirochaetaceae bacterium]|jgi:hypothetical protein|nr:hypothetical protein [Spirochaetaceae bacterium]